MFTERDLENIREGDSVQERLQYIFSYNQRVEAFTPLDAVETREWLDTEDLSREAVRELVDSVASSIDLDKGEAVLAHETTPTLADKLMKEGFTDPFEYSAEDIYHIPGSNRYGKAFFWPHLPNIGHHDKDGALILCVGEIEATSISTYASEKAVEPPEYYESLDWDYDRILPDEYDQYHVFQYREYVRWLETDPDIEGRTDITNILPYCLDE